MSFEVGRTVGDYQILQRLGQSHNGVAFKVRNTATQRLEVLKVLPNSLRDSREQIDRFLREMKVHARTVHPNIASFYQTARLEDTLVMTSEWVEGTPLESLLDKGALPIEEALEYAGQVLAALAHAHVQGIIHREITPGNITVTPDRIAKVANFSLAKAIHDPQLTRVGTVVGAPEYTAPEQFKGVGDLDARADLYAVGVILYRALTGQLPFTGRTQFEVMAAQVNAAPAPASQRNPKVPKELDRVLLRALAKEPADRFQSADEFRGALTSVASRLESAPARNPVKAPRPSPSPAADVAHPTLALATGAIQADALMPRLIAVGSILLVAVILAACAYLLMQSMAARA